MRTLSLDLRERIPGCHDSDEGTRPEIAHRFRVSLAWSRNSYSNVGHTGDIAPRYRFCGRKPMIVAPTAVRCACAGQKNDLTLKELREARGLKCLLAGHQRGVGKLGLTYKKDTPCQ